MVTSVGGQAVIEGVMMKYESRIAVAVRDPSKNIVVRKVELKVKENKIPFVRGVVNLFVMMFIGVKTLNISADIALGKEETKKSNVSLVIALGVSLIFALFLFKLLPLLVAQVVDKKFSLNSFEFNFIDGLVRFLVLLLYLGGISRIKDIQRVFQYHGAEHKVVNCFESGKELTVKNVQSFTTVHKRCGTTFVFLVLFVSIFVFMLIPKSLPFGEKLGLRILFLPLIASVSYEILRLGAKYSFLKPLIFPGLLIQKITTREPDDSQVEVAIESLKAVL